jgi:hypothetical protein
MKLRITQGNSGVISTPSSGQLFQTQYEICPYFKKFSLPQQLCTSRIFTSMPCQ